MPTIAPWLIEAGTQTAAAAGQGIMGMVFGGHNDRRQVKQQRRMNKVNMEYNKEMTEYNMGKQMEMWKNTGYGAQKDQMKEAGLSPGMMYGMSGAGGSTTNIEASGQGAGQAPAGGREIQDMMGMGMQMQLLKAQKENIEADTKLKEAGATKTAGIDTELGMMDKIIKEFAGKEAKDQYEKIKKPWRGVESKTYGDEMEARQGIAGTIGELWGEGKLHDKSIAEIEGMLIQNAKGRAERQKIEKEMDLIEQNTKGKSLENIITELESKLQTQTGIDRNSPTWLKVLGRLFVELTK